MQNRTAVVIGASRGIGAAIAKQLAQQGEWDHLILTYRSANIEKVHQECASFNLKISLVKLDLNGNEEHISQACDQIANLSNKQIAALIYSAGVAGYANYDLTAADNHTAVLQEWRSILQVNLHAAMQVSKLLLPAIQKHASSSIIFIGSDLSFFGIPQAEAYCASKFGFVATNYITIHSLRGFCACLLEDVREHGIRVCMIHTGAVNTEMMQNRPYKDLPFEKMLQPSDVARAVQFVLQMPAHVCVTEIALQPQSNVFK